MNAVLRAESKEDAHGRGEGGGTGCRRRAFSNPSTACKIFTKEDSIISCRFQGYMLRNRVNEDRTQLSRARKKATGEGSPESAKKMAARTRAKPDAQPTEQKGGSAESAGSVKSPIPQLLLWAQLHLAGKKPPFPESVTVDFGFFDTDLMASLILLIQRLQLDGLGEMPQLSSNSMDQAVERMLLVTACTASPYRIAHTFHKLISLMLDCITAGRISPTGKFKKSSDIMAATLAVLVYKVQKLLEGRQNKFKGDDALSRLWEEPAFQQELHALRRKKKSYSPKRRFAKFVCNDLIGYLATNARLNGKVLVLHGVKWERPKTNEQFTKMRPIFQAESVRNISVYADMCEEDDPSAKIVATVRGLKTDRELNQFYHQSEFDEAFRSLLGLSPPRKKQSAKPLKRSAKPAKGVRKKQKGNTDATP